MALAVSAVVGFLVAIPIGYSIAALGSEEVYQSLGYWVAEPLKSL